MALEIRLIMRLNLQVIQGGFFPFNNNSSSIPRSYFDKHVMRPHTHTHSHKWAHIDSVPGDSAAAKRWQISSGHLG